MIIDLHIHTSPLSPCSEMEPAEAVEEAKKAGLDAICFTEHNRAWDAETIARLREQHDFLILMGLEIDSTEGHVIAFGLYQDFKVVAPIAELRDLVIAAEGFLIAAHPFRGFLVFGFPYLSLGVEQAAQKPVFNYVDAVEAYSGRMTDQENNLANQVSEALNLRVVGGSDAHRKREIGRCVTIFEGEIHNEEELIRELKAGRFTADYLRR